MSQAAYVSVLMPVRNEGAFIARSIGSVLAQDYPGDRMEVLVADGMSTDETRKIVSDLSQRDSRVRLIDNLEGIVATGLNRAMREARGDIIVRVDGHCEVAPDYVRRCVVHLQNDNVHGVGGPLETIGETPLARAIAAAMSSWFGVGGSAFRTVRGRTQLTDTVAFPGYRRDTMELAGPFDEELVRNQDDEYNYRLRRMGARILLAADVRARYYSRSSFRSLWRQYLQYGYWKVRVMQKHPLQMQPRQFVPAAFVAALSMSLVLMLFSVLGVLVAGAILGAYAAAVIAALIAVRPGTPTAWGMTALAFATVHTSYGIGMWAGLFRFWNRWGDARQPAPRTQTWDTGDIQHTSPLDI